MHADQHPHSHHRHEHVHAPGERHPHAKAAWSLLRLSGFERLAIAAALAAILWATVFWAVGWRI